MLQETAQQTGVNRYTVTHTVAAAAAAHGDRVAYTCSQDTLASASQLTNRHTGAEERLLVSMSKMSRAAVRVKFNVKIRRLCQCIDKTGSGQLHRTVAVFVPSKQRICDSHQRYLETFSTLAAFWQKGS